MTTKNKEIFDFEKRNREYEERLRSRSFQRKLQEEVEREKRELEKFYLERVSI